MLLFVLAYLGGALTILSPCILPVLPFVFGGAGRPFRQGALPLLAGMALTFTVISSLAVAGGSWVVHANNWGRIVALVFLSFFAVSLLFPQLAELIARPFVRLGSWLQPKPSADGADPQGASQSFLLGMATGLLWAPCAGPILGLILAGAALKGASVGTSFLLLAFALGSATSLVVVLSAGGGVLRFFKSRLGFEEGFRKVAGALVLLGVFAIAMGWDRGVLTRLSLLKTEGVEKKLLGLFKPAMPEMAKMEVAENEKAPLESLAGATGWLNSPALTPERLRGHVVLVDFWTYSCINCLRSVPYIQAWHEKYKDSGLVIIGVHAPEFAFEKDPKNVEKAVRDLKLTYPVAIDTNYSIWNAFKNQYWPAHYFIDANGRLRGSHFGEGDYEESEAVIQKLLAEARLGPVPTGVVETKAQGAQAKADDENIDSPETYLGYDRAENQVVIPAIRNDQDQAYLTPSPLKLNQWGLVGVWNVSKEHSRVVKAPGRIVYRFHARDLHLVLGPGAAGKPVRFVVTIDGKEPGEDHGVDINAAGQGEIREERLYQLIRQKDASSIRDRTFTIEFLDPGAEAFAFTFG